MRATPAAGPGAGHGAAAVARIGPNAITQCMAALQVALGEPACQALLQHAGLAAHGLAPPQQMVDEDDVVALHRSLRAELGLARARAIGREAGLRTGAYLLAHRIPGLARVVLPHLPAALASRLLLAAISAHAWTFCGSGVFSVLPRRPGQPLRLAITGCATCRGAVANEPLCDYFAATFERLFRVLVHPRCRVTEEACAAMGAPTCVFALRW